MIYGLALALGRVSGLRAVTVPAAVSWTARLGALHLDGTWLAVTGYHGHHRCSPALHSSNLSPIKLPSTPSRKVPMQFEARLVSGAFSGAALGASGRSWIGGFVAGVIGAVIGAHGGAAVRARMAGAFGRDLPAALIEDAATIILGVVVVASLR